MENRKGNAEETHLLTATTADGTSVRAEVEGEGRVMLILHPGMNTAKSYEKVAARLGRRYRVIRLYRRQYRLDLKTDPLCGSPCTVAQEVEHVLASSRRLGSPSCSSATHRAGPSRLKHSLPRHRRSLVG